MRKVMLATAVTAAIAMAATAGAPASAAVIRANGTAAQASNQSLVTHVRWRGHGGWHHHGWHRGGGWGPAIGAGIAGLAIGSALAARPYYDYDYYGAAPVYAAPVRPYAPSVAWCEQHYRSYDPGSQTYLGYDGVRHSCP
jgi:hypothetical protein